MTHEDEITIFLQGKSIKAKKGRSLLYSLSEKGIFLRADCGGNGRCTKCMVKIIEESTEKGPENIDESTVNNSSHYRNVLSCQTIVTKNLVIEIPKAANLNPDVIHKGSVSQKLKSRIFNLLKNDFPFSGYCAAVDIGTTTIAIYLCNMDNFTIDRSISLKNPQTLFGQDIMSRISSLAENPMVLIRLHKIVIQAIDYGIHQLCLTNKPIDPKSIKRMAVVGNSVMLHLFLRKNPSSIGVAPYHPEFYDSWSVSASRLGFNFNNDAEIFTLPLISGFLGADIVAASLAVDLQNAPFGSFLADVGTNGELMAVGKKSMTATSCSTGPALEGASIKHGMQAVSGAISTISINMKTGKIKYSVKGNKKPEGICGSGIISAVAELLRTKIILPDGRFDPISDSNRLRLNQKNIPEFVLVPEKESGTGKAITLTQADIRNIQLAKGAFRTGIDFLCKKLGLDVPHQLLVAGAFGNYIRKQDAITIGMFPPMPIENIHIVGNAAGEGAILTLFDPQSILNAWDLARNTQVIDLASQKNFQDHFVASLPFPEP
jgi:uncharacterized 2Fe-2S/4Fe-4S cluster protein (DUF4445 family)